MRERKRERVRESKRERERGCRSREGKTSSLKEMMSVSAAEPRSPTRQGEVSFSFTDRLVGTTSTKRERERETGRGREKARKTHRLGKQTDSGE